MAEIDMARLTARIVRWIARRENNTFTEHEAAQAHRLQQAAKVSTQQVRKVLHALTLKHVLERQAPLRTGRRGHPWSATYRISWEKLERLLGQLEEAA